MTKKLAALVILMTIVVSALPLSRVSGAGEDTLFKLVDVYWKSRAGTSWTLTVVLEYTGEQEARDIRGSLYLMPLNGKDSYTTVALTSTAVKGQRVYFDFTVTDVLQEVSHVTTWVNVEYTVDSLQRSEKHTFTVSIRGRPDVRVVRVEASPIRGEYTTLNITLENVGDGVARDLEITLQPQSIGLDILESSRLYMDRLVPGEGHTISTTMYVHVDAGSTVSLIVGLTYEDDFQGVHSESVTFTLSTSEGPSPILSFETSTTTMTRGMENYLTVTLTNVGNARADNVTVKVAASTPSCTVLGVETWRFQSVGVGEHASIPLTIYLSSSSPDAVSLTLSFTYTSELGDEVVDSVSIGFKVVDPPEPKILYTITPAALLRGSVETVAIELFNAGGDAINVTASIAGGAGVSVLGNTTFNVGDLDHGARSVLKILVYVDPRSEGAVPMTLTLEYEDIIGRTRRVSHGFNFMVSGERRPLVEVSTPVEVVRQGASCTLPLQLSNKGGSNAYNVTVRVSVASPAAGIIGSNVFRVASIPAGGEASIPVRVYVEEGASGLLTLTVQLSYFSPSMTQYQGQYQLGLKIENVTEPYIVVYPVDSRLSPGRVQNVTLKVENVGGPARNVTVQFQPGIEPLTILSTPTFHLKRLGSGEAVSVSVPVYLDPSVRGGAVIVASIRYEDLSGRVYSRADRIGYLVGPSDRPILEVYSRVTRVKGGSELKIPLVLVNTGSKTAYRIFLNVRSSTPQITVLNSSLTLIDVVKPGESVPVLVGVYTSEGGDGPYVLEASLTYYDENNVAYRDSYSIGFAKAATGDPIVNVESMSEAIRAGEINELKILVKNDGGDIARNVTIQVFSDPKVGSIIGASILRLGSIPPGGGEVAEFKFQAMPSLYGAVALGVVVSYEDSEGEMYTSRFTLGYRVEGEGKVGLIQSSYSPSPAFPGDEKVSMVLVVVNTGNYTLEDVVVELMPLTGIIRPSPGTVKSYNIAAMQVGEPVKLSFTVDVEELAIPGVYRIPVRFKSKDGTFYVYIPFEVRRKADLQVRLVSPQSVRPGEKGVKLTLELFNNSNDTLKDVSLEVQSPYVTGTTTAYISEMIPRSRRIIVLEVDVSAAIPSNTLPLDVSLSWTQHGRSASSTEPIYVPVTSAEIPEPIKVGGAMIAVGAIVVAAIMYRLRRRF